MGTLHSAFRIQHYNAIALKGVKSVYKRRAQGWLKHADFILLDLLSLHIAFILAYFVRNGFGEWPYVIPDYRMIVGVKNIVGSINKELTVIRLLTC